MNYGGLSFINDFIFGHLLLLQPLVEFHERTLNHFTRRNVSASPRPILRHVEDCEFIEEESYIGRRVIVLGNLFVSKSLEISYK